MFRQNILIFVGIAGILQAVLATGSANSPDSDSSSDSDIESIPLFRSIDHFFGLPDSAVEKEALNKRGGLIWKRPDTPKFPNKWHSFKAKNSTKSNEKEVEFVIKDIPESRFNESVDLMALFSLRYNPLFVALKLWSDADAVNYIKSQWRLTLKQKMSVACFKNDGSDRIVGIDIMAVEQKDDVMYKLLDDVENEKLEKLKDLMDIMYDFDTYDHYKVDRFLNSYGLAIDPDYENYGIDVELLRSREKICKKLGIKVTSSIFTSTHSNTIANALDFKVDDGMSYNDVRKILPGLAESSNSLITLRSIDYSKYDKNKRFHHNDNQDDHTKNLYSRKSYKRKDKAD